MIQRSSLECRCDFAIIRREVLSAYHPYLRFTRRKGIQAGWVTGDGWLNFRFRFSEDRSIIADSLDGETTWRLVLKIAGKFF